MVAVVSFAERSLTPGLTVEFPDLGARRGPAAVAAQAVLDAAALAEIFAAGLVALEAAAD